MSMAKKLASCCLVIVVCFLLCACSKEKSNDSAPLQDTVNKIISSRISTDDYEEFMNKEFSLAEKWDFDGMEGSRKVYYDGDKGYLSFESYSHDYNCVYYIEANGYALGVETPERLLEVSYLYYTGTTDLTMYAFSGIGLEHCAKYVLKVFENSPAKITVEEFLKYYNGGKEIDPNETTEKTLVIRGVQYLVKVEPVYTLDGELLSTDYSITASLAKN